MFWKHRKWTKPLVFRLMSTYKKKEGIYAAVSSKSNILLVDKLMRLFILYSSNNSLRVFSAETKNLIPCVDFFTCFWED